MAGAVDAGAEVKALNLVNTPRQAIVAHQNIIQVLKALLDYYYYHYCIRALENISQLSPRAGDESLVLWPSSSVSYNIVFPIQ